MESAQKIASRRHSDEEKMHENGTFPSFLKHVTCSQSLVTAQMKFQRQISVATLVAGVSVGGRSSCVPAVLKGRLFWCFCRVIVLICFPFHWFASLETYPTLGDKRVHLVNNSDRNYVNCRMWKVASSTFNCGTLATHMEMSI